MTARGGSARRGARGSPARPLGRFASLALVATVVALVVACKPKEGGSCRGTAATCTDPTTALVCRSGTYVAVTCRGPGGCAVSGEAVTCDDSTGTAGDTCFGVKPQDYACSSDGKEALHCEDGRFVKYLACRGPQACKVIGRTVSCDTAIAEIDDPCLIPGQISCSTDRTTMLQCVQNRFAVYRNCRGRHGCYFSGDIPGCDETRAKDGDPCGLLGLTACSDDGTHEMQCNGTRFSRLRPCRSGPCTVVDHPTQPIACK